MWLLHYNSLSIFIKQNATEEAVNECEKDK